MIRLLVHVEGQTEETFVNEMLAPYLYRYGYSRVSARLMGNARQRNRRGGIKPWPAARKDIMNHLREDPDSRSTTMADYYGLPRSGPEGWPGRDEAATLAFPDKANAIQDALMQDVREHMGGGFNPRRFVPYVMMHEFEALLFSDCDAFSRGIGHPGLTSKFQEIRDDFPSPEEINDSPHTAPSGRVKALLPGYEKTLMGILAALEIGLDAIRSQCPNFRRWLRRLESPEP